MKALALLLCMAISVMAVFYYGLHLLLAVLQ